MSAVIVTRRLGEAEIAAVSVLLQAASAADGHAALGEHKWLDLVEGRRSEFSGFLARLPGEERLAGYAHLSRGEASWAIEFVVHPSLRGGDEPIGLELVRAALAEVAREGGGHVHLWVPKPSAMHDEIAAELGLSRGRELYQMRRRLPVEELLSTVTTRPFRPSIDDKAWLEVNNRAFHAHPEQGSWTAANLAEREHQPWFDPTGFLLHEVGDRIAAFCWTKIHDDEDPPLGEIYVIGVDPDFQGRGLGRELVLAGLEYLAGRGLRVGMLYVDADNTPAVGLYRSLGFEVDHLDRAYVGDVKAAS